MVLLDRIELSTSSLPMTRSTTELQQQPDRPQTQVRRAGAAYGWTSLACQGARLDGEPISRDWPPVSKAPSPADIERERRLTGDAAHELRSPLTAIKTHLQVARMTEGEAREQSLAHAEAGADRLHRTLEQLLLLARVEGSLSFDDGVNCSAGQVAHFAVHDAAAGEGERIRLHLPPELPDTALEVPSVLAIAALRNLLDNALRHAPAGTQVELTVSVDGPQVKYQVRDHGPGIPAETLQHMTQRFWRNGNSNGCGLGLAIVQAIVERCRCELSFDSQPDGLRVELRMPLKRSA